MTSRFSAKSLRPEIRGDLDSGVGFTPDCDPEVPCKPASEQGGEKKGNDGGKIKEGSTCKSLPKRNFF